jgi:hypothetical protein
MARTKMLHSISGTLGVDLGMDTTADALVTEDDDGDPTEVAYTVDLTKLLSELTCKQLSQMATYRVTQMGISLRNVDNTNDNDYGIAVGGRVRWYSPTNKRVDALQHARNFKRSKVDLSGNSSDPYAPWQNEKHYKSLRANWKDDAEVPDATTDDTAELSGTYFSFEQIFDHYNAVIAGTPAEEGRPTSGEGMANWITRAGFDQCDQLFWDASYKNSMFSDGLGADNALIFDPLATPWSWTAPSGSHAAILGGLLRVSYFHTNTDNPRAGETEDEYQMLFTATVEGWKEF